ncbi:hypothetical protein DFQ28_004383 [Apophysomyces sp. BC1034]|nr:hypothetical protein DFQ30_003634 [Apophysomyces sp. BC1015]KAG0178392.1 hypothetical protein DFQ29_003508 [Apophysomyces sp. BC1021]KAG0188775.1 hypothetical protein DFQ28_004383 [Apophysomyces sp. BC1034]
MLQSQILNALPRRILATLWASQETRISLSQLSHASSATTTHLPVAATPSFLCAELPVRFTHLLRLLSTLSPELLQTPIIRHVAHQYLYDICTLVHPSLRATSQSAFSDVLRRLRHRQAASLVRLRYALLSSPTPSSVSLMESINNIGIGIHVLAGQHLSWSSDDVHQRVQSICPIEIAEIAVKDAREACAGLGQVPEIAVHHQNKAKGLDITYAPGVLHRVLYESMVLALRAQMIQVQDAQRRQTWFQRQLRAFEKSQKLDLQVFGGATSVGFRLESPAPLSPRDLVPNVPRDAMGMPSASGVLSRTRPKTIHTENEPDNLEWECLEGWRTVKQLASHWGGHLDCVSADGLGTTIYLALERDATLVERYPTRSLASSAHSLLRHHRRISAAAAAASTTSSLLTLDAATTQLDTFLHAISDPQHIIYQPLKQDHSVSLNAAVSHA